MKTKTEYRVYCGVKGYETGKDSFYPFDSYEEAAEDMKWRQENIGRAGYYYKLVKVITHTKVLSEWP